MKKKTLAEPIVSPEILAMARQSVESDRPSSNKRCAVCGASCKVQTAPHASEEEDLCWVCRRLKISAWRDSDQQIPAQE